MAHTWPPDRCVGDPQPDSHHHAFNGFYFPELAANLDNQLLSTAWAPMAITLIFLLPLIAADSIPKDHQSGVTEIIRTTSLTYATYLIGKVLSVWVATFAGLAVIMVLSPLIWLLVFNIMNWENYLQMWLIGISSLVILNSTLAVLIATGQPTRRRAIITAFGVFFVLPFMLGFETHGLAAYLNPVRYPISGILSLRCVNATGLLLHKPLDCHWRGRGGVYLDNSLGLAALEEKLRMIVWHQFRAMIYYETLMLWRRGSLRLISVGLLSLPLAYLLIVRPEVLAIQALALQQNIAPHILFAMTTSFMVLTTLPLLATVLVAVPVLISEVMPLDQQYGVYACLQALPLTRRDYLAGKVLGAWAGLTAAMLVAGIVIGLAGWLSFGPFDLVLWASMWSLGLLVYALFTSGFSVLLAATQPNRRRAVLVGLAVVPVVVGAYYSAPIGTFQVNALINLTASSLVEHSSTPTEMPPLLTPEFLFAISVTLLGSGLLAWYRLCRMELHS